MLFALLRRRFSSDRFMPRINPGEEVLRSLQANFASLAITTEDVLMTGAVGVGSLVEAAKQAAMETELALHHEPEVSSLYNIVYFLYPPLPASSFSEYD
jgi:predicted DNA-binding protein with PD1-like motif